MEMGHGSWVTIFKWVAWVMVTGIDPLTHDDEITVQWLAKKLQATKLLTHSVSPIIIVGGLTLTYNFLLSRPRGLSSTTTPRPLLVPCGHWSWVMWVMGQLCDGSHGSWVTKNDPFPSLPSLGLRNLLRSNRIIFIRQVSLPVLKLAFSLIYATAFR